MQTAEANTQKGRLLARAWKTAESYCVETNSKGYFLKWFPVHFVVCGCRLCARKVQVANTKLACRKSTMKKFAPQLRTCSFVDYLSQTPSTVHMFWFSGFQPFLYCDPLQEPTMTQWPPSETQINKWNTAVCNVHKISTRDFSTPGWKPLFLLKKKSDFITCFY